MNQTRATTASVLSAMLLLFNRFTVTTVVNYPDDKWDLVTYWINTDAEQRYNELKENYDRLTKEG